jgi:hypothetical protein
MIVESSIIVHGMTIRVHCSRQGWGYTAELVFEDGDRAVIDARTLEELEQLIGAIAIAAATARQYAAGRPREGGVASTAIRA